MPPEPPAGEGAARLSDIPFRPLAWLLAAVISACWVLAAQAQPISLSFGSDSYEALERSRVGTIVTLTLGSRPSAAVTVTVTATPQGGASASDYSVTPTQVVFRANSDRQMVTVSALADSAVASGKEVRLGFGALPSGVTGGSVTTADVALLDTDRVLGATGDGLVASMQVGAYNQFRGYSISDFGVDAGELIPSSFTLGGTTITVAVMLQDGDDILLYTKDGVAFPESQLAGLELHLGGVQKAFADQVDGDLSDFRWDLTSEESGTIGDAVVSGAIIPVRITTVRRQLSFVSKEYVAEEGGSVDVTVFASEPFPGEFRFPVLHNTLADYQVDLPEQVILPAGESAATFTVGVAENSEVGGDATVLLAFGDLSLNTQAGRNQHLNVTIRDNDKISVGITGPARMSVNAIEDRYRVTLSERHTEAVTVQVLSDSGDPSARLTILAGSITSNGSFTVNSQEQDRIELWIAGVLGDASADVTVGSRFRIDVQHPPPPPDLRETAVFFDREGLVLIEDSGADQFAVRRDITTRGTFTVPLVFSPNAHIQPNGSGSSASSSSFGPGAIVGTHVDMSVTEASDDRGRITVSFGSLPDRVYAGEPSSMTVTLIDKAYDLDANNAVWAGKYVVRSGSDTNLLFSEGQRARVGDRLPRINRFSKFRDFEFFVFDFGRQRVDDSDELEDSMMLWVDDVAFPFSKISLSMNANGEQSYWARPTRSQRERLMQLFTTENVVTMKVGPGTHTVSFAEEEVTGVEGERVTLSFNIDPPAPAGLFVGIVRRDSGTGRSHNLDAPFDTGVSTVTFGTSTPTDSGATPGRFLEYRFDESTTTMPTVRTTISLNGAATVITTTVSIEFAGGAKTVSLRDGEFAQVTLSTDVTTLAEGSAHDLEVRGSLPSAAPYDVNMPVVRMDTGAELGTLTIRSGQTAGTLTASFDAANDGFVGPRTVTIGLAPPWDHAPASVTVSDDSVASVTFTRLDENSREGDTVRVRVDVSPPLTEPVTVSWRVVGAGRTLYPNSGSVTVDALQAMATITTTVDNDDFPENRANWLMTPAGYSGPLAAQVTNDVNENAQGAVEPNDLLTVRLDGPAHAAEGVTATYTVSVAGGDRTSNIRVSVKFGGTADPADYSPPPGALTIPRRDDTVTFEVPVALDPDRDFEETIVAGLTEVSGGHSTGVTLGGDIRVTTTISEYNRGAGFPGSRFTVDVAETVAAGSAIEAIPAATDQDGDPLTYSLSGGDAGLFAVGETDGRVSLADGQGLDFEAKGTLKFTVRATDGRDGRGIRDNDAIDATMRVTVRVTDVDEPPPAPGAPVLATTDAGSPTPPPAGIGPNSFLIATWDPPELPPGTPPVTAYALEYRAGDGAWEPPISIGSLPYAEIYGLEKNILYRVRVRAVNEEGEGPNSPEAAAYTLRDNQTEVMWTEASHTGNEGTMVTLTVTRGTAESRRIDVPVVAPRVSSPADHSPTTTQTVALASGSATATVRITLLSDSEAESPEEVLVSLGGSGFPADVALGEPSVATVTIVDAGRSASDYVSLSLRGETRVFQDGPAYTVTALAAEGTPAADLSVTVTLDVHTPIPTVTITIPAGQSSGETSLSLRQDLTATVGERIRVRFNGMSGGGASQSITAPGDYWLTVIGINTPPTLSVPATSVTMREDVAEGSAVGDPFGAADPESDTLLFTARGGDNLFVIGDTGQVRLRDATGLDFETAERHVITVGVSDRKDGSGLPDELVDDSSLLTVFVRDVGERPGAVGRPVVAAAAQGGHSRLVASWSPPPRNGAPPASSYDVEYRVSGGEFLAAASRHPDTSVTIGGLESATSHEVRVRARNSEGTGDWSRTASARTGTNRGPVFADAALTFTIRENSAWGTAVGTALRVTDLDMDPVYISLSGAGSENFTVGADLRLSVANGATLDHERTPTLTVTVFASDGSASAAPATVTVNISDVAEVPDPPGAPTVEPAGPDRLSVSWVPALTGDQAPLTGYDVQYRAAGSGGDYTRSASSVPSPMHTVTGLMRYTGYEIQVRSKNALGVSPWSAAGAGRTDPEYIVSMAAEVLAVEEGSAASLTLGVSSAPTVAVSATVTVASPPAGTVGADEGADFSLGSTVVTFGVGQRTGGIRVTATDDPTGEADESFIARISGVTAAGGGEGVAGVGSDTDTTVTIPANDAAVLVLTGPTILAKGQTGTYTITVDNPDDGAGQTVVQLDREGPARARRDSPSQYEYNFVGTDTHTVTSAMPVTLSLFVNDSDHVMRGETFTLRVGDPMRTGVVVDPAGVTTTIVERNLGPRLASPVDNPTVSESTSPGSSIGSLRLEDPEGDSLSYSLSGPGSNLFEMGGDGRLKLKRTAILDFESGQSHTVTVRAWDGRTETGFDADGPEVDIEFTVTVSVTDELEPPGRPGNLAVAAVGSTSATLTWTAPMRAGMPAITGYDVQMRPAAGSDSDYTSEGVDHIGASTDAVVAGLAPSTGYRARVRARNPEDTRDGTVLARWREVSFSTGVNRAPRFADRRVTFTVDENTAVGGIVGDPLGAADQDEDALMYTLTGAPANFGLGADQRIRVAVAPPDHESAATHTVVLRADDPHGGSDRLTVVILVEDVPEPPPRVPRPAVSAETEGEDAFLVVRWAPSVAAGAPPASDHDLRWRELESGTPFTERLGLGRMSHAEITLASADELTYEVQVRAINAEGTGEWSESGTATVGGAVDINVDGAGAPTAHDALLIFYSWRFGDFLRANPRLLNLVYGRILRQSGSTLTPEEVLGNAEVLRTLPGATVLDVDGTGEPNAHDALLIFYSWRFGDFLRANPRLLNLVYGRILRQSGSTLTPTEVLGSAELLL